MSEKDRGNLLAIVDSCIKIERFTNELGNADAFFSDEKTFDAVLLNFVIIGEAVSRITDELKGKQEQIPWRKIKAFRNLIAHNYFGVDAEEVWQIIHHDLPGFQQEITDLL